MLDLLGQFSEVWRCVCSVVRCGFSLPYRGLAIYYCLLEYHCLGQHVLELVKDVLIKLSVANKKLRSRRPQGT